MSFAHDSNWFYRPAPPKNAAMRLFCFPCAGGGSLAYMSWQRKLPREFEVIPALLPGRESRLSESPATSMASLVAELAQAITPLLDLPYALFGHSMGSMLAYELAHSIQRGGLPMPKVVIASASSAPHLPRFNEHQSFDDLALVGMLKAAGGCPPEALEQPEVLATLLPIFRADLLMLREYGVAAVQPLKCPLVVYGGDRDALEPERLSAWTAHTSSACPVRFFPGGHFYHQEHPRTFFHALALDLQAALRDAPRIGL